MAGSVRGGEAAAIRRDSTRRVRRVRRVCRGYGLMRVLCRRAVAQEAEERRAEEPAPKKPKAAPKPAAPAPLKKGQKTMASFFGKK
eukprot:5381382-Prymnesium_polylepis.2